MTCICWNQSSACKITFWGLLGLIISSLSNLLLSLKCFLWLAIFSSSFLTSLKDLTAFIPTRCLLDAQSRQSSTNEVSMLRNQHSRWWNWQLTTRCCCPYRRCSARISRSRIQDPIPIVVEHNNNQASKICVQMPVVAFLLVLLCRLVIQAFFWRHFTWWFHSKQQ